MTPENLEKAKELKKKIETQKERIRYWPKIIKTDFVFGSKMSDAGFELIKKTGLDNLKKEFVKLNKEFSAITTLEKLEEAICIYTEIKNYERAISNAEYLLRNSQYRNLHYEIFGELRTVFTKNHKCRQVPEFSKFFDDKFSKDIIEVSIIDMKTELEKIYKKFNEI